MAAVIFTVPLSALANELTIIVKNPSQDLVKNIVVYVTPEQHIDDLQPNTKPLYIDQIDKKFAPYITVLQRGQAINFANKDDITHHIYSVSGENRFEFKIKKGHEKSTQKLNAVEEVAMGCNIHDWMSGYALVVDTPFFGKTNEEGKLTLSLPQAGAYTVTIWHPQLDVQGNRISEPVQLTQSSSEFQMTLPKSLLPIPEQSGQDDFDFLEGY